MLLAGFFATYIWIVLVIGWVLLAFWPARMARRKGHSFLLYFLFSLVFFPLALFFAYMSTDRRPQHAY
jgi:amino acid transporter